MAGIPETIPEWPVPVEQRAAARALTLAFNSPALTKT